MHSQVPQILQFSYLGAHRLRSKPFAHPLCLVSALIVVDASGCIVAAFPADGDGRVVAGYGVSYKVKVSIQAA